MVARKKTAKKYNPSMAVPTEAQEQKMLIEMIRLKYPMLLFRVGMEAGKRNPRIAKQQGVTSGWPDLYFPHERRGFKSLWIELKRTGEKLYKSNGEPKDQRIMNQIKIIDELRELNHCASIKFGAKEAMTMIDWYFAKVAPT